MKSIGQNNDFDCTCLLDMYITGVLNVSNITCVILSRCSLVLKTVSVSNTGYSTGAIRTDRTRFPRNCTNIIPTCTRIIENLLQVKEKTQNKLKVHLF